MLTLYVYKSFMTINCYFQKMFNKVYIKKKLKSKNLYLIKKNVLIKKIILQKKIYLPLKTKQKRIIVRKKENIN